METERPEEETSQESGLAEGQEAAPPEDGTASPEEFEQDPARNPDDDQLEEVRGG